MIVPGIGTAVGSIAGGIGGYWLGSEIGETIVDFSEINLMQKKLIMAITFIILICIIK